MKTKFRYRVARVLGIVVLILFGIWTAFAQPSCRSNTRSNATVNPGDLRKHVETLSIRLAPRDWLHPENLNAVASYISGHLQNTGAQVNPQAVKGYGLPTKNIIGSFSPQARPRIIVGAHYDAYMSNPGADDNASGVASLLELSRLLGKMKNPPPVDLVAYTLEEPPHFATDLMGSAVHAESLAGNSDKIQGVIVLEMIGYFSDERFSQSYPMPMLYLMYPTRGNFIGVVSRWDQGEWIKEVKTAMKGTTGLPVYSLRGPSNLPGIDFSDHRNYWKHAIPSLMITDTSFYRNKSYHTENDTFDKLDYDRLAQVTIAVFEALKTLSPDH